MATTAPKRYLVVVGFTFAALLAWQLIQPFHARPVAVTEVTWEAPMIPETISGQRVAAYLTAFNSGDPDVLGRFVTEHFSETGPGGSSLAERSRSQQQLYNSSRGLDLFQITQLGPDEVQIVARLRLTQAWRQMTFYFESTPPHPISGIRIVPIDAPAIPDRRQKPSFEQALDSYLDRLAQADQFSGVVMVTREGKLAFADAYGDADKDHKLPNSIETHFNYASVGKMFTAIAIGQLLESGRLSLEDKVSQHVPNYPRRWGETLSIDHLLTHRSGIADFFEVAGSEPIVRNSTDPQRDYQEIFCALPLRFAPGEKFEYSNSNYILLGAIIEAVSGQRYDAYIKTQLFEKAGMTNSVLDLASWSGDAPATGYTELAVDGEITPGVRYPNHAFLNHQASAAGGGITTAGDLIKFADALRTFQLVTPATTIRLTGTESEFEGPRPTEFYVRGFMGRHSPVGRVIGHSGGFPGVDAQVDIYESGWTVIVLANYEAVGEPVARYIESLIADETQHQIAND